MTTITLQTFWSEDGTRKLAWRSNNGDYYSPLFENPEDAEQYPLRNGLTFDEDISNHNKTIMSEWLKNEQQKAKNEK